MHVYDARAEGAGPGDEVRAPPGNPAQALPAGRVAPAAGGRRSPGASFRSVMLLSHQVHQLSHYCHGHPLIFAVP
ncbi:hypothetical protein BGLA2_80024 [Burkholderia gladioli]|nr:hypothetical protein BGLA2_80024 [Burkholderia gladioli]